MILTNYASKTDAQTPQQTSQDSTGTEDATEINSSKEKNT